MYFLVNASAPKLFKLCSCIGHMMQKVLGYILSDFDLKVKCHIMDFLVNASLPKPLDAETSNCACAFDRSHDVEDT